MNLCGNDDPKADDKLPPRPLVGISDARRQARYRELQYGFFYCDFDQIDQTKDFVTFVHVPYAGPVGIVLAQKAAAAGLPVIMSVGECGFDTVGGERVYRGSDAARGDLGALLTQLAGVTLLAAYTLDEPNGDVRASEADLTAFCADCRAACPGLPLMTIYGGSNGDRPGMAAHDWLAIDDYGQGKGVLGGTYRDLRARMVPGQSYWFVPACAASKPGDPSPWCEPPWIDEAVLDDLCIGIAGFDYCGFDGVYPGLREGAPELQQAWADAGRAIINAKEQPA